MFYPTHLIHDILCFAPRATLDRFASASNRAALIVEHHFADSNRFRRLHLRLNAVDGVFAVHTIDGALKELWGQRVCGKYLVSWLQPILGSPFSRVESLTLEVSSSDDEAHYKELLNKYAPAFASLSDLTIILKQGRSCVCHILNTMRSCQITAEHFQLHLEGTERKNLRSILQTNFVRELGRITVDFRDVWPTEVDLNAIALWLHDHGRLTTGKKPPHAIMCMPNVDMNELLCPLLFRMELDEVPSPFLLQLMPRKVNFPNQNQTTLIHQNTRTSETLLCNIHTQLKTIIIKRSDDVAPMIGPGDNESDIETEDDDESDVETDNESDE